MATEETDRYKRAFELLSSEAEWENGPPTGRKLEHTLLTLIPHSKKPYFMEKFEEDELIAQHLKAILLEKDCYEGVVAIQALRLLRNACARREKVQKMCSSLGLHEITIMVLKATYQLIPEDIPETQNAAACALKMKTNSEPLQREFIMYGVQFLCNFCTANRTNASAVWQSCFPSLFEKLLSSTDEGGFGATAALMHNCIACAPFLMYEVVATWDGKATDVSTSSQHLTADAEDGFRLESVDDNSKWVVTICRLSVGTGNVATLFDTLLTSSASRTEVTKYLVALDLAVREVLEEVSVAKKSNWSAVVDVASVTGLIDILCRFADDITIARLVMRSLSRLFESEMETIGSAPRMPDLTQVALPELFAQLKATLSRELLGGILRLTSSMVDSGLGGALDVTVDAETAGTFLRELSNSRADLAKRSATTIKCLLENQQNRQLFEEVASAESIAADVLRAQGIDIVTESTSRKLKF